MKYVSTIKDPRQPGDGIGDRDPRVYADLLTVSTRTVGQKFATCGTVTCRGELLHETRDFTFGDTGNAYRAAMDWAQEYRRLYSVRVATGIQIDENA